MSLKCLIFLSPHYHDEKAPYDYVEKRLWFQAMYLIAGNKKDISGNQFHHTLSVTPKAAWFMSYRIGDAMRLDDVAPYGGDVEVDGTFIGQLKGVPKRRAFHHMTEVLALIDRDTRQARTIIISDVNAKPACPWSYRTS